MQINLKGMDYVRMEPHAFYVLKGIMIAARNYNMEQGGAAKRFAEKVLIPNIDEIQKKLEERGFFDEKTEQGYQLEYE